MTGSREGLYLGEVVHKRVRPRHHALCYRVFAVLFDCDRLQSLDRRLPLFSYNRFNLFSLHDRDHGDGTRLGPYLRRVAAGAVNGRQIERFQMLCYPRILGYAFNPLTVYFGLDARDRVRLVVYEVNNTFGERKSYVLPVGEERDGVIAQGCRKRLYVSPFNTDRGTYSFRLTPPGDDLTVGVALRDGTGPVLKAHFHGRRQTLTTANLLAALARTGWMTVKVIGGIHYEALKLWLKGMRPVPRPAAPETSIAFIDAPREST